MDLKIFLSAAAIFAAGISVARADVYSYTQPISSSWAGNNYITAFSAKPFNNHRGNLSNVILSFVGTVGFNIYGVYSLPFGPPPSQAIYDIDVGILGAGSSYSPTIQTNVASFTTTITNNPVMISGPIAFTSTAFSGHVGFDFRGFTLGGAPLGYDFSTGYFNGQMVETLTYTDSRPDHPHPVPEPASLALLGTAVGMLTGMMRITRRRRRD